MAKLIFFFFELVTCSCVYACACVGTIMLRTYMRVACVRVHYHACASTRMYMRIACVSGNYHAFAHVHTYMRVACVWVLPCMRTCAYVYVCCVCVWVLRGGVRL